MHTTITVRSRPKRRALVASVSRADRTGHENDGRHDGFAFGLTPNNSRCPPRFRHASTSLKITDVPVLRSNGKFCVSTLGEPLIAVWVAVAAMHPKTVDAGDGADGGGR